MMREDPARHLDILALAALLAAAGALWLCRAELAGPPRADLPCGRANCGCGCNAGEACRCAGGE